MLAKYVLALLKNERSEEDLETLCRGQLEDFLQDSTNAFVDSLFKEIRLGTFEVLTYFPSFGIF